MALDYKKEIEKAMREGIIVQTTTSEPFELKEMCGLLKQIRDELQELNLKIAESKIKRIANWFSRLINRYSPRNP